MLKKLRDLLFKEEGQGLTEYALIISLIAIVAVTALGNEIIAIFNDIVSKI